jgi:hypothetical protein
MQMVKKWIKENVPPRSQPARGIFLPPSIILEAFLRVEVQCQNNVILYNLSFVIEVKLITTGNKYIQYNAQ